MERVYLWDKAPGMCEEIPYIDIYIPEVKKTDAAVLVFPGGGYIRRAEHERENYAKFLNKYGMTAFIAGYRVAPHRFPLPLLDARRCMRYIRANAEKFGIDKNKVAAMGSSAGGHLTAMLSTYTKPIDFEGMDAIDEEAYMPNLQIMCYPAIDQPNDEAHSHTASYMNLIGKRDPELETQINPVNNVCESTPEAFFFHTNADPGVSVINSYVYATALRKKNIPVEMHVFPDGGHGLGLAPDHPHTAQWSGLLINWFKRLGWL